MRNVRLIATCLGVALLPGLPVWSQSPSELLEKGMHEEKTAGHLDLAIEAYAQILSAATADEKFRAQAQYRLGRCYLKKRNQTAAAEALGRSAALAARAGEGKLGNSALQHLRKFKPVAGASPRVVFTSPPALADDVSPSLSKITVTFDRPMMDQSWSWTGGGETYPKITSRPRYDKQKTTCTLPVKLEPGKVYWVGVNSPSHRNFQTPDRRAAPWYVILFATRGQDGKPTPIPADLQAKAVHISWREPIVVHTSPAPFSRSVSPSLTEITVTFDRPMLDGGWSWTGGGETYPEITARPGYDEARRTCTLPVKLEPGKAYWVGINSPSHKNFKAADGTPAPWYVIVFATQDDRGKPTSIPGDMLERASKLNAGMPLNCIPATSLAPGGE
jgi:hypothetical protein